MSKKQTDAEIVDEVVERHRHCRDVEATARNNFRDDLRFLYADAYNQDQWDPAAVMARQGAGGTGGRPCLTVNKTLQHVLQVTNSARQQTMGVKIVATGFGASQKAAEVLEGIIRHIEAQSNAAQNAYANAIMGQVGGGIGYIHITTDYVRGVDSFDQDLFIETVPDPLCVMLDPDAQEPDKSDAGWGMLITEMPRKEFDRLYPRDKDVEAAHPFDGAMSHDDQQDWDGKERVRVARYYRRSEIDDTLWATPEGPVRESALDDEAVSVLREAGAQSRPISDHTVEWFLIGGSRVLDSGETVFKHVPLVPWIGIETHVDGKLDRKGLTRLLIDPQRMFNYSASKFIEGLAAQTIGSWTAPDSRVKGREAEWAMANISPPGVLIYNSEDPDSGTPIADPPPEQVPPPQFSPGYLQAMQSSDQQMQMASGQYQAEMGAPSNERSGRAIGERQRQSDTANYHFTDNQGMALRLIGKILLDAIPRVYDVTRAVQVMGIDGTMAQAIVDPSIQQAHQQVMPGGPVPEAPAPDPETVADVKGAILAINPAIGRYDVVADVGPSCLRPEWVVRLAICRLCRPQHGQWASTHATRCSRSMAARACCARTWTDMETFRTPCAPTTAARTGRNGETTKPWHIRRRWLTDMLQFARQQVIRLRDPEPMHRPQVRRVLPARRRTLRTPLAACLVGAPQTPTPAERPVRGSRAHSIACSVARNPRRSPRKRTLTRARGMGIWLSSPKTWTTPLATSLCASVWRRWIIFPACMGCCKGHLSTLRTALPSLPERTQRQQASTRMATPRTRRAVF